VRRLDNLLGTAVQLDIDRAEADLSLAQARLDAARRQYELVKEGPDPADVRVAQARLANAQAQLAAAQAAVANLELHAPFSRMVSEIFYKKNEWVAPGQPVLLLADLTSLQIETTYLNEIDATRVKIGDMALVTFDALPEVEARGRVERIAPKVSEGSGVNYPVIVVFEDQPEGLRLSMTAFVDIQVPGWIVRVRNLDRFRARTVGFIFQLHNLLPTLTALENVEVPMVGHLGPRARRKHAKELLDLVGLPDRMRHLPNQLLGGQRQRVAVARALANDLPLVLADEPTGSLDTAAGQELLDLLHRLNRDHGTTFVLVTHDPAVARQTRRVVVMSDGRIIREDRIGSPLEEDLKM
jgi:ABC-type ATPase involved in cell division